MKRYWILFLLASLASCSTTDTVIMNSWKDPESNAAKEQFKKVMVVALVKDDKTRRNIENTIVDNNPIFKSRICCARLSDKSVRFMFQPARNVFASIGDGYR